MLELRQKHPLSVLLSVAGLARATFYYHMKQLSKPDKYAEVKQAITTVYAENRKRIGYRRITSELRTRGFTTNHKTVQRWMKQLGIFCRVRMKRHNSYRGNVGIVAPDLLQRDFHADKPNQKWVTDVTEFKLFGQKLYLSPIMDLFNGELISYSMSHRPQFSMVTNMLEQAFQKIPDDTNLTFHSDQGWLYQLKPFQRMLETKGLRQSMSRKGNCLDNAAIESFFAILKSELLHLQAFSSMEHFKAELVDYLDYYNNRRIKLKLKGMCPVKYRLHTLKVA